MKDSVRNDFFLYSSANMRHAQRFNQFIAGTLLAKRLIDAELQNGEPLRRKPTLNPSEFLCICDATVPILLFQWHLLPASALARIGEEVVR